MASEHMLTPAQIRAARALLNLSQDELPAASGLARQSIKNIERGVTDPRLSTAMIDQNDARKGRGAVPRAK